MLFPSWWCVAPLTLGLCCVVLCCVALCYGVLCFFGVWWWCVAPLMVKRVVVVCAPPHGGAVLPCVVLCCVALWCVVPKALLPKGKRPGCLPTGTGKRAGLCVLCARRA